MQAPKKSTTDESYDALLEQNTRLVGQLEVMKEEKRVTQALVLQMEMELHSQRLQVTQQGETIDQLQNEKVSNASKKEELQALMDKIKQMEELSAHLFEENSELTNELNKKSQISKSSELNYITGLESTLNAQNVRLKEQEKTIEELKRKESAVRIENDSLEKRLKQMSVNENTRQAQIQPIYSHSNPSQSTLLAKNDTVSDEQVERLTRAGVLAYSKKEYEQALGSFAFAIKIEETGSCDKLTLSRLLEWKGECCSKLNMHDQAVVAYSEAIKNSPDDANLYQSRGLVYMNYLKEYEMARKDFMKVLSIWPDFENAKALLSEISSMS